MNINFMLTHINNFLWQWPMLVFVGGVALVATYYLNFIQFSHFFKAWKLLFSKSSSNSQKSDMNPLQAFLNTLSASIGNGSIAGMATAVYSGGPGAAIWLFIFGFFGMILRFAEVYLSSAFGVKRFSSGTVGGPLVYLSKVPGGTFLPSLYATILLIFCFAGGAAMQSNSIALGCVSIFPVQAIVVAIALLVLMLYIMFGGTQRIIAVSTAIVPFKVGCFCITALYALIYHQASLLHALDIMVRSAFGFRAVGGGLIGYWGMMHSMRYGLARGINASEAGLGTASVLFGGAPTNNPTKSATLSMVSSFFTSNIVCFSIMLIIVASGVWDTGKTSIDLTIAAYQTVFGTLGAWIVTLLAIMFGLGTMIAYAYIAHSCWTFLTNAKGIIIFNILFSLAAFLGCISSVEVVWNATDLINAALLIVNLYGIVCLLPTIKKGIVTHP